ncbi:MAG: hypothetical protein COV29_02300 [Candidatus Yanofskybacteria bacterium CG10_big_fil_rev_8_21_14_0_10_36_16]|uniref:GtrA/DPMS transmembrane domain-containing protein n=1 Tax=Candidatus Yanofskybacteria bacterium CG10_big_fil_rev_8_21_14_0_10_36_16 TaxID=1975096 RepID=A0A2J0Q7N1_9BACT|nr:MAG: hypothetical protein COV29_02300 [Candidatus Yanofskybacteria bacterium CG10_big_fil_rev_8_21_14_0_10_36_16]
MDNKKNIIIAILLGIATGIIWAGIFVRLNEVSFLGDLGSNIWLLILIFPLIFVLGIYLGRWLSGWHSFFVPFSRFAIIGFLNTGVDLGILNLLIYSSGMEIGLAISVFKGISFLVATTNSYFFNKHWAFEARDNMQQGVEFVKFFSVSIIGVLLNVSVFSVLVSFIGAPSGLSHLVWINAAAIISTIANLIWNFIGYRMIVFKNI